ncbi:MAG: hypothetical protein JXA66_05440 [Oligoflexia bacterium]|nr:hypothetical protein [Oligoflexia bacterium]
MKYLRTCKKSIWLLPAAFALRLLYGVFFEFRFEDELQIYLLGLKFFTTGSWPFFGPDIVYTHTQINGALQALLAGLPFYLFKDAVMPYVLLNVLSFAALFFLSWYCVRLTAVPRWIVWGWLLFCPWTMNFSTHVINPSYVLFGAVLFFIAFLESASDLRVNIFSERVAFAVMGFGFFWIFQLHLSWVLLVPVLVYAFVKTGRPYKRFFRNFLFFILGSAPMLALVVPTFIRYGIWGTGGSERNIVFNVSGLKSFFDVLFRTLSFAGFEVPRFIGHNTEARLQFVYRHVWAVPFILYGFLLGLVQPLSLIYEFFKAGKIKGWNFIRYFLFFMILVTYLSFFFSVKGPSSHAFYLLFPVVSIYAFYAWSGYLNKKAGRVIAMLAIISSLVFHLCIAVEKYGTSSMFALTSKGRGRDLVNKALVVKDYHVLGARRCETGHYKICY